MRGLGTAEFRVPKTRILREGWDSDFGFLVEKLIPSCAAVTLN
jgi:hypothetical protein